MQAYCASAPGKILWLGGYAVLERGNTSLVTAVDKRVHARAEPRNDGKVILEAPQLKATLEGKIEGGKLLIKAKGGEAEKLKFLIAAARNTLKYLHAKGRKLRGLHLTAVSDAAFGTWKEKTGLGSSAAVTVAATAAIIGAHGLELDTKKTKLIVHNLSQLSHSEAQGKVGSGFDVAASAYGSTVYSRYSPEMIGKLQRRNGKGFSALIEGEWDYSVEPTQIPKEFIPAVAFTSLPVSTSAMVRKISEYKRKGRHYRALIREIDAADGEAIKALRAMLELREKNFRDYRNELSRRSGCFSEFSLHFQEARLLTKKLGEVAGAVIEPSNFTKLIQISLGKGGGAFACRLPGAGGGDSLAAICLSQPEAEKLKGFWRKLKLKILDLGFGNEGMRREAEADFGKIAQANVI